MVLFLRDKDNTTVVDISLYKTKGHIELSSSVMIIPYSKLLLATEKEKQGRIMEVFDFLSELRGWLWETHFMGRKNTDSEYNEVQGKVRTFLDDIGNLTDLHRVED